MYCVKCGVELANSEVCCPLCKTRAYHPDVDREIAEPKYPDFKSIDKQYNRGLIMIVITVLYFLPAVLTLLIDLRANGQVNWSGYVVGAQVVIYTSALLPFWFQRPNPVIFVPCAFASVVLYLWYIDFAVSGNWFLSFAMPITVAFGIIVTAVVTLTRYIRKGHLYIWGGASIAFGAYFSLIELLMFFTFDKVGFVFWSLYPFIVFFVIGILLIVIAICRPIRESLHKKFFI
ncbi:MAG: hypothetical protein IJ424_05185 [Oscillospiraceae bacterium]|nr:hypothetical protein [Oscillospiraceae bacterium]